MLYLSVIHLAVGIPRPSNKNLVPELRILGLFLTAISLWHQPDLVPLFSRPSNWLSFDFWLLKISVITVVWLICLSHLGALPYVSSHSHNLQLVQLPMCPVLTFEGFGFIFLQVPGSFYAAPCNNEKWLCPVLSKKIYFQLIICYNLVYTIVILETLYIL